MTKVMQDLTMTNRWTAVWDKESLIDNFKRRIAEEGPAAGPTKEKAAASRLVSQSGVGAASRGRPSGGAKAGGGGT